jgi:hypothetical protein
VKHEVSTTCVRSGSLECADLSAPGRVLVSEAFDVYGCLPLPLPPEDGGGGRVACLPSPIGRGAGGEGA